jgi:3-deoxy-D-manno-octulosonate 8-phosphate phosphatase KdsC-like HAD superfamily phosphatase
VCLQKKLSLLAMISMISPTFKLVGLPLCCRGRLPEIFTYFAFRTAKPGGFGVVREICDLIFHAQKGTLDSVGIYVF